MKLVKHDLLQYFTLILSLIVTAGASSLSDVSYISYRLLIVLGVVYILIGAGKLSKTLLFVVLYWTFVNLLTSLRFNSYDGWFNYRISIVYILTGYLVTKIIGDSLYLMLEKIIYYLTIVSIPLFFLQQLVPSVYDNAANYLNMFTRIEQKTYGGWYIGVYMYSAWAKTRNCGFMWEPGGFAMMLVYAQTIWFLKNDFKFDKHSIVYLVAMITTYSTMGYLAFGIIYGAMIYSQKKSLNITVYIVLLIFGFAFYRVLFRYDFMLPKLMLYLESADMYGNADILGQGIVKFNRIGYFFLCVKEILVWPFGVGLLPRDYIGQEYGGNVIGVGAISEILLRWGWIGISTFLYSVNRTLRRHNSVATPTTVLLLTAAIAIALFSNPGENGIFTYSFLFFSYVTIKKHDFSKLAVCKNSIK